MNKLTLILSGVTAALLVGAPVMASEASDLRLERKDQGVGSYVGAGVLMNRQGVDGSSYRIDRINSDGVFLRQGNGYSANRTVFGGAVLARVPVYSFETGELSARPYVNFVSDPYGSIGAGGGALVTYDYPVSYKTLSDGSKVSNVNVYGGVGVQVPFTNNTDATYQAAVGRQTQVVFGLGVEGRVSDSFVAFADLKLPTRNDSVDGGSYSPVFTVGGGIKF